MSREPLAYRMKPAHISEIVGQKHVIGKETALYKMIQNGHVPSVLFYGPPGVGKTSLAKAISGTVNYPFMGINATTSGKKDVENAVKLAKEKGQLILFIDEIHRFNKLQQDYLLPHVEQGLITLIGATTENPFHEVNPAIRSRCGEIKELRPLSKEDIKELLIRTLQDAERGLGNLNIYIEDSGIDLLAAGTNGDARSALNVLEEVIYASKVKDSEDIVVVNEVIEECLENKGFIHDKGGDIYYDLLSSLQKSIRGSDVNASLFWMARLLEGGDLKAICRRLIIIGYEDISLAAPEVSARTVIAMDAVERVGLPEARIILAQVVVELCLSAKSNSAYSALDKALMDVKSGNVGEIPKHLRDSHYKSATKLGNGTSYKYPHDYPRSWVDQQYLPDAYKDREYYSPKENGFEKHYKNVYDRLKELKGTK